MSLFRDLVCSSTKKLEKVGQEAGRFFEDAKGKVSNATGRVHGDLKSVAAKTETILQMGVTETKKAAEKTAQTCERIVTDIERWGKGVASSDLFGGPIDVAVQRQQSSRPIHLILVKCADYLVLSGLHSKYLFKAKGDKKVIQQLVYMFSQGFNASIPEGLDPIDVAALAKCYIASLPEPLTTFKLYNEIKNAHSCIHAMRNVLDELPKENYMTIELVIGLLLRVSQKSVINKMDAQSLAREMTPLIMWQRNQKPESYGKYWSDRPKSPSEDNMDSMPAYSAWDMLSDDDEDMDASSHNPLDDDMPVKVIKFLIEEHNTIFTDANESGND